MSAARATIHYSSGRRQRIAIDLPDDGLVRPATAVGGKPPTEACLDLLDLAGVVYQIERAASGRHRTAPPTAVDLEMPLRAKSAWTRPALTLIGDLLQFLGNASWRLRFERRAAPADKRYVAGNERAERIVLFSGGLDSFCGAAVTPPSGTRLVSFYTRQKEQQVNLAAGLGHGQPLQWSWSHRSPHGRGHSFYYRSFLFLSMAAVAAYVLDARMILQYENGLLATAVAPSPAYRMTRHAHPHLAALFGRLIREVLGTNLSIENPFLLLTKRQAFELATTRLGGERATSLASTTQSCWGFWSPRLPGGGKKRPGRHCGVCTPCVIRRTALRDTSYVCDITRERWLKHPECGRSIRAYNAFLERVRRTQKNGDFYFLLDGLTRADLLHRGYVPLEQLRALFGRFASEFHKVLL